MFKKLYFSETKGYNMEIVNNIISFPLKVPIFTRQFLSHLKTAEFDNIVCCRILADFQ